MTIKEISPGVYQFDDGHITVDHEYVEAYEKSKNEKAIYYTVSYVGNNGHLCRFTKQYTPSIAALFAKRDGKTYTPMN